MAGELGTAFSAFGGAQAQPGYWQMYTPQAAQAQGLPALQPQGGLTALGNIFSNPAIIGALGLLGAAMSDPNTPGQRVGSLAGMLGGNASYAGLMNQRNAGLANQPAISGQPSVLGGPIQAPAQQMSPMASAFANPQKSQTQPGQAVSPFQGGGGSVAPITPSLFVEPTSTMLISPEQQVAAQTASAGLGDQMFRQKVQSNMLPYEIAAQQASTQLNIAQADMLRATNRPDYLDAVERYKMAKLASDENIAMMKDFIDQEKLRLDELKTRYAPPERMVNERGEVIEIWQGKVRPVIEEGGKPLRKPTEFQEFGSGKGVMNKASGVVTPVELPLPKTEEEERQQKVFTDIFNKARSAYLSNLPSGTDITAGEGVTSYTSGITDVNLNNYRRAFSDNLVANVKPLVDSGQLDRRYLDRAISYGLPVSDKAKIPPPPKFPQKGDQALVPTPLSQEDFIIQNLSKQAKPNPDGRTWTWGEDSSAQFDPKTDKKLRELIGK